MPQSIIKERKMISDVYRPFSSLSVALLREASAGQSNGSVSNYLLRLGRRFPGIANVSLAFQITLWKKIANTNIRPSFGGPQYRRQSLP